MESNAGRGNRYSNFCKRLIITVKEIPNVWADVTFRSNWNSTKLIDGNERYDVLSLTLRCFSFGFKSNSPVFTKTDCFLPNAFGRFGRFFRAIAHEPPTPPPSPLSFENPIDRVFPRPQSTFKGFSTGRYWPINSSVRLFQTRSFCDLNEPTGHRCYRRRTS